MAEQNQFQSEVRLRSGPDRCIWHANRGKSNQLLNQSMSYQFINQHMAQVPMQIYQV